MLTKYTRHSEDNEHFSSGDVVFCFLALKFPDHRPWAAVVVVVIGVVVIVVVFFVVVVVVVALGGDVGVGVGPLGEVEVDPLSVGVEVDLLEVDPPGVEVEAGLLEVGSLGVDVSDVVFLIVVGVLGSGVEFLGSISSRSVLRVSMLKPVLSKSVLSVLMSLVLDLVGPC